MIRFVILTGLFVVSGMAVSCGGPEEAADRLYGSDEFTVYADSIVQGAVCVKAVSPVRMIATGPHMASDTLSVDIDSVPAGMPRYESEQCLVDFLYNKAAAEILNDTAAADDYAIYISEALLVPERSSRTLMSKIIREHGDAYIRHCADWPVSDDRMSWAAAMWELYKVTGDASALPEAVHAIENSLNENKLVMWDDTYKLMHGEQLHSGYAVADYPEWMDAKDRYESMCLGTNVMFAEAFKVRDSMITRLPDYNVMPMWVGLDKEIADAVNNNLWIPNLGFYSRYLYGGVYPIQSQAVDNFGQALAIIFGIANREMARSIVSKTPWGAYGVPAVYPFMHGDSKEGEAWPVVQACWTMAAAKAGNMAAVERGMASLFRAYAMSDIAESMDTTGDTVIGLSDGGGACAGIAAIVLKVVMGMELESDGIVFAPVVPEAFGGRKRLYGMKYRGMELSVTVSGSGSRIKSFSINGEVRDRHFLPADMKGKVNVEIIMDKQAGDYGVVTEEAAARMPATPAIEWGSDHIGRITNFTEGIAYNITINGDFIDQVNTGYVRFVPQDRYAVVDVVPVMTETWCGFSARPYEYIPEGALTVVEMKTPKKNGSPDFEVEVSEAGDYFMDVGYRVKKVLHGCALYMIYIDGAEAGGLVMPLSADSGDGVSVNSNMLRVKLKAGKNRFSLRHIRERHGHAYDGYVIECVRLIKQ